MQLQNSLFDTENGVRDGGHRNKGGGRRNKGWVGWGVVTRVCVGGNGGVRAGQGVGGSTEKEVQCPHRNSVSNLLKEHTNMAKRKF